MFSTKQRGRLVIFHWRLFCILFLLFLPSFSVASTPEAFKRKSTALNLDGHPFWLDLLHYKGSKSQILDDDFFLSPDGKIDPKSELEATIDAFFSQEHSIERQWGDQRIECIFPARYTWLDQKLNLPSLKIDEENCPGLSKWARVNQVSDISVIYASGYLGNPASSFGHVLLNLKIEGQDDLEGLFDRTINYGATVPLNENMLFYVVKGVLGGYKASFSDKYFYSHDQVYARREFRDIWEYTLSFSDEQRKLFVYHIAELLTKRYTYYFFNENCAQRIAVLLDMFIKEDVYDFNYPVYIPEKMFQRFGQINEERLANNEDPLIKEIKYIPSARRNLFYEIETLTDKERTIYREIADNRTVEITPLLADLPVERRIVLLNALLAYQYYQIMADEEPEGATQLRKFKDKLLIERLRLPPQKQEPLEIPKLVSPNDLPSPLTFDVGLAIQEGNDPYTTLGATVYRRESIGQTALEFRELIALNLNIGIGDDSHEVFIDRFDFLSIKEYQTFYIREANEFPLSWKLRVGVDRYRSNDETFHDYTADGGIGIVKSLRKWGLYYGFINSSIHSENQNFRAFPSVGFVIGQGDLKAEFEYEMEFGLEDYERNDHFETKLQYQMNNTNAIQLAYRKNFTDRLDLKFLVFW